MSWSRGVLVVHVRWYVGTYSPPCSDFDDVGSEVDLFSQDIARAMGELGTGEDYSVETLGNWDLILPQGI